MLHPFYLVWLKGVSYLAILQSQIHNNIKFSQKLLLFLQHIIKCWDCKNLYTEILDQACSNANDPIATSQFANLLRVDNKAIVQKVKMYLFFHNLTCYKYNICKSKVYKFDFLQLTFLNSEIDLNKTI